MDIQNVQSKANTILKLCSLKMREMNGSWLVTCTSFLCAALTSACTYHGNIRSDFFQPSKTSIEQKIPLKVALVKGFDESVFRYRGNHSVEIQLSPGLTDASKKALESVFPNVEVIDSPLSGDKADLLAFLRLDTQERYRNAMTGQVGFDVRLALTLKENKSRNLISSFQSSTTANYSPSAETHTASFLTGFSLFLLSPVTIPWTTNAIGRDAESLLEETLEKLLGNLARKVASDDALTRYVAEREAGGRYSQNKQDAPPSKAKKSSGSGFVVSREGYIVTNHHVIEGCSRIEGTIDGHSQILTVIQTDPRNDLALLKMKATSAAVASFRDGAKLRAGDSVVAIGFPLHGLLSTEASVTAGMVSSMTGIGGDSRMLQITAPIQPGNSGGPLLDMNGSVIGIVVAQLDAFKVGKATGSIPQNVNFAVSSTIARAFLDSIGVNYETSNTTSRLETADVAESGKKFTTLIQCFE